MTFYCGRYGGDRFQRGFFRIDEAIDSAQHGNGQYGGD